MRVKRRCLICVFLVWLGGFLGLARAADRGMEAQTGMTQLKAGPLQLVMRPGAKATLLFTTPCMQLNHIDGGVGPFATLREWLARSVVDGSRMLPVDLQPVCM